MRCCQEMVSVGAVIQIIIFVLVQNAVVCSSFKIGRTLRSRAQQFHPLNRVCTDFLKIVQQPNRAALWAGKNRVVTEEEEEEESDDADDDDNAAFMDRDASNFDPEDGEDDLNLYSSGEDGSIDIEESSTNSAGLRGALDEQVAQSLERDDPFTSPFPTVNASPPPLPFEKWYVLVGDVVDSSMRSRRSKYWTHHIQWARRCALLEYLQDDDYSEQLQPHIVRGVDASVGNSGEDQSEGRWRVARESLPAAAGANIAIRWEYTMLSENCMHPIAQVIGLRANSTSDVREYLESEPLVKVNAVSGWKIFELKIAQPLNDNDITLSSDMHDPYLLMLQNDGADDQKFVDLLRQSEEYHRTVGQRARDLSIRDPEDKLIYFPSSSENDHILYDTDKDGEKQSLLYGYSSRVVMLADLIDSDSEDEAQRGSTVGQLLLFNARSRADAQRYLRHDPIAGTAPKLFPSSSTKSAPTAVLSAINEQDIDGLFHVIGRSFATHHQLNQIHYIDPEDLLFADTGSSTMEIGTLGPIQELPSHFEMNALVLNALKENKISFKYNRFNMREQLNLRWGNSMVEDKFEQFNSGMASFQRKRTKPELLGFVDSLTSIREGNKTKGSAPTVGSGNNADRKSGN